jgi:hypothetical protein
MYEFLHGSSSILKKQNQQFNNSKEAKGQRIFLPQKLLFHKVQPSFATFV